MCGRTSLAVDVGTLSNRFGATPPDDVDVPERYNVAPREDLVAIRDDAPGTLDRLEWGLLPDWADDPEDGPRPVNARAETVAETPMFRDAYERRRCLVLADGFYEWADRRGGGQPYRIERVDGEPFAVAGLWARWDGGDEPVPTCTLLTCEANDVVGRVYDRMPVLLEPAQESTWLDASDSAALEAVLEPYPDESLRAFPVSRRVNDPSNDGPDLAEPADVGEQSGLDDFAG